MQVPFEGENFKIALTARCSQKERLHDTDLSRFGRIGRFGAGIVQVGTDSHNGYVAITESSGREYRRDKQMPKGRSFKGKPFEYEGSIDTFLRVYPLNEEGIRTGTVVPIDGEAIRFIKETIRTRNNIQMGACRDNPAPRSLGEALQQRGKSPQFLSYILPLLEKAGFITHYREGNAFWVRRNR